MTSRRAPHGQPMAARVRQFEAAVAMQKEVVAPRTGDAGSDTDDGPITLAG